MGKIERLLEIKDLDVVAKAMTSEDWQAAMSAQGRLDTLRSVLTGQECRVFNPYLDIRPSKYL